MNATALSELFESCIERVAGSAQPLDDDATRARKELERALQIEAEDARLSEAGFWFRAYVRSFFSYVEGVCYSMRHVVLECHGDAGLTLSLGELVLLSEKRFHLADTMKVTESTAWNKLPQNLRLAFSRFPRLLGIKYELDWNPEELACFSRAQRVRDRLTHPKADTDLSFTIDEIYEVDLAREWFLDQRDRLVEACYVEIHRVRERSAG